MSFCNEGFNHGSSGEFRETVRTLTHFTYQMCVGYVERHRAYKEKKMFHEIAIYSHEEQKWVVWGFYEACRFQDLHAESCVWQWETSICIYIILLSLLNHFGAVKNQQFWLTYCNPLCLSLCIPLSASAASSAFYSSADSIRCHAPLQGETKKTIILWLKNSSPQLQTS